MLLGSVVVVVVRLVEVLGGAVEADVVVEAAVIVEGLPAQGH